METIKIIKLVTSIIAIIASFLAMFTIMKYRETKSSQDYNKWIIYMIIWISSILIHYLCR